LVTTEVCAHIDIPPSRTYTHASLPPRIHTSTPTTQIYVSGATELLARTREEVAALLQRGGMARATAAHKMNSESSRSHAIVTLTLEQHVRRDAAAAVPKVWMPGG